MDDKCSKCGKEIHKGQSHYADGPHCVSCHDAAKGCESNEDGRCKDVLSVWFGMSVNGMRSSPPCDQCLLFRARDARW